MKICGVRTLDDALACVAAGADAIGMLVDVSISPRSVIAAHARQIVAGLPPFVTPVIVMMPSSAEDVVSAGRMVRPGAIQLHGEEPPEMLRRIKGQLPWVRLIKTIHVGAGNEIEKARSYEGSADAILLDTLSPARGGSGQVHDWSASADIISAVDLPVLLAGGLTPANVADAVRAARPFAVDVSSGVENGQYRKDMEKVRAFISRAKGAEHSGSA
ncbi:MAG: N-(5'-phosphoribosyl)anthranilate isomerase [Methanocella sp. PtaU1.Bin125]|nr:MAG: N-(5'-phosphoribosyl)anthranilate isomerase [Methanocella sp. PtaU1.Bin125]